jgi:DNA-binding beta-propeller fold protein YncE
VSPDGAHVYAAALRDHSITVFARSPLTGRLAFVERQGAGGGHGLGGAADVAVSPDGAHVYAVGYLDWTVSVFTRNAGTGALSFVQVHTGGPGGLADLAGPTGLALSPDGSRAYVASATADSLLIFTRDGASGALAFREARRDGDDGVDGLDAVLSVAVAPDDATVYTAALADNSAAAFAVLVFGDGFDSGTLSAWSAAATDTGDLMADGSAAQAGTSWGLRASVDDTAALYVQDDSPQGEARYRARFYLDPDDYDPGEASGHFRTRLFLAFAEPNRRVMALVLRRRGGQYALIARLRRDDGTQADAALPLGDGPRLLEVEWSRASAEAAADGSLTLWMDGVPQLTLGGVDNDQAGVDFVRLGALNVKPGAAGVLRFDEFESRRLQYIGPP